MTCHIQTTRVQYKDMVQQGCEIHVFAGHNNMFLPLPVLGHHHGRPQDLLMVLLRTITIVLLWETKAFHSMGTCFCWSRSTAACFRNASA